MTERTDAGRLDRRAMRERAERATPGRWRLRYLRRHSVRSLSVVPDRPGWNERDVVPLADVWLSVSEHQALEAQGESDASFIAHARSDVPALLDLTDTLVERLRGAIALLDEFDRYASVPDDTGYATSPFRARIAEAILDDLALLASLGEGEE